MKTVNLTKEGFLNQVANYEVNPEEWTFKGVRPCVIDFYADWCGPCKMVAPLLDELAEEYAGKVDFYKIDTEVEEELAIVFNIRTIPTLLFCPMIGAPQMASGVMGKAELKKAIDEVLLGK